MYFKYINCKIIGCLIIFYVIVSSCQNNQKLFFFNNTLQGIRVKINFPSVLKYKLVSKTSYYNYSYLMLDPLEPGKLPGLFIVIYTKSDFHEFWKYEDIYVNPLISTDSIRSNYKLREGQKLIELTSDKLNNRNLTILKILVKEDNSIVYKATINQENFFLYLSVGGVKNSKYFTNNFEKMIKSIRIEKIDKLNK